MQEHSDQAAWIVLGVPVLGLLALSLLRWVPTDHVLVVTRRGRVARVVPAGLRVRAPMSASVLVPTGPDVALLARGTTREGIQVRMYVEARTELVPPRRHERYVDPVGAAAAAAEDVLAETVGSAGLVDLPDLLRDSWDDLTVAVDRETAPRGLRVRSLRLAELDAVLTEGVVGPRGSG